jgi:hypothetical protein
MHHFTTYKYTRNAWWCNRKLIFWAHLCLVQVNLKHFTSVYLQYFSLPPRCKWDLRSYRMLCSVHRQLVTDVLGQPIGPIFKGQAVQQILDCLTLQDGTDWLSWNVCVTTHLRSVTAWSLKMNQHDVPKSQ